MCVNIYIYVYIYMCVYICKDKDTALNILNAGTIWYRKPSKEHSQNFGGLDLQRAVGVNPAMLLRGLRKIRRICRWAVRTVFHVV